MHSEAIASGKEWNMRLNLHAVRWKVMDCLRRPFLQRLVTLVAAMLLAMGLVSAALVMAASRSADEVASISAHWSAQEIFADAQGAIYGYAFMPETLMSRHQFEQLNSTVRRDSCMERWQRS